MKALTDYRHTIYASYIGYITQAIVNNLAPLLFLTFRAEFGLSLGQITLITTLNFLVQLTVDLLSARFADRLGYRSLVVAAHVLSAAGLIGLALLPSLLPPYAGVLISVILYAIGGGLIEVLISPIVEACPTDEKNGAMSLLHSFYCWGQVAVVLLSTAFFAAFGRDAWRLLAVLWALIPLFNVFYFRLVPLYPIVSEGQGMSSRELMGTKLFWLFFMLMVAAGASELAMSQWASAFAESALGVSKALGDLMGPCAFAVLMGSARAYYGTHSTRLPLRGMMIGCAALCVGCYLLASLASLPLLGLLGCAFCGLSVGLFWPGTFSIASRKLPRGGTAMFALLALAGDVGCTSGPTLTGLVASAAGGSLQTGLLAAVLFPAVMLLGLLVLKEQ